MPGKIIKDALENGISCWPDYEGRWPVTSGVKFSFDPSKPAGERIIMETLRDDNDQPIDMEKIYSVSTTSWLLAGKDGYDAFTDPSVVKCTCELDELYGCQDLFIYSAKKFQ